MHTRLRVGPVAKRRATLLLLLLLSSCNKSPYADMPAEEIHAKARTLPLEQRYAFYLEVLESRIPENPDVADDLVLLGEPARKYVIEQALKGDSDDLHNALSALSAFDGRCTADELRRLREKARLTTYSEGERRLTERHILVACEIAAPPGYKIDYGLR